jgi:hypothetical protein
LIQPFIDYCIGVWAFTSNCNTDRVQKFQNRCARILTNNYNYDVSGSYLVKSIGHQNVLERRDFIICTLVHKCLYEEAPNYLSDQLDFVHELSHINTRNSQDHSLLYVPFARTSYFSRSFSVSGPKCWNKLPQVLRDTDNIVLFKTMYKNEIGVS